jgi:magnesium-transporting ATPase (P-type)
MIGYLIIFCMLLALGVITDAYTRRYDRRLGQPAFDWSDSGRFAVQYAVVLALIALVAFVVVTAKEAVFTRVEAATGWDLISDE